MINATFPFRFLAPLFCFCFFFMFSKAWAQPCNVQTPTKSSNAPICEGNNLTFTAGSATAGVTYTWILPGGATVIAPSFTINNASAFDSGKYFILYSTGGGCTPIRDSITVTVSQDPKVLVSSNSPRCEGDTLKLNATFSFGASYLWTGPSNFNANVQNPEIINATTAATGVYTLTVSAPGCSDFTRTVSVEVNLNPTANPRSNAPICAGDLLRLTADSNPAGAAYLWSGPSGYSSTDQNPFIFGAAPFYSGLFTLRVTLKNCSVTETIDTLLINPPPKATATSNSPVCAGATLLLTGNAPASQKPKYTWSGPNNFSSSLLSASIANIDTARKGAYKFKVEAPGCKPDSVILTIAVNPAPNPTPQSSSPACIGGNLTLSTPAIPNAAYLWRLASGDTSRQRIATFTQIDSTDAGDATLTVTVPGCTAVTRTLVIVANKQHPPLVLGNNSPLCIGKMLELTGGVKTTGATYQWRGPANFSSDSLNPKINNITGSRNGVFTLTATVPGCSPVTATTTVQVDSIPELLPNSNSPVCAGGGLVLSAAFVKEARYTWRTPRNITYNQLVSVAIPNVTPSDSGVYFVEARLGTCIRKDSVSVKINTPPTAPNPFSNAPICTGDSLLLTATNFVGATYAWQGPANFSSTLRTPSIANVTTLANGTYRVTVTVPACLPVTGAVSVAITQRPNPAISVNSPVCTGNTLQLAVTPTPGATYLWQGPGGFRSVNPTVNRNNATPSFGGLYQVRVSVNGCDTVLQDSVTVNTALQRPVPASNAPLCTGDTLRLTATGSANASYSWQGPAGFSSNEQNPSLAANATQNSGWYRVEASLAGCPSLRDSVWVAVAQRPVFEATSNSPVCEGATINLGANISGIPGARYRWNGPKGFSAATLNASLLAQDTAAKGNYILTLTLPGCVVTDTVSVNVGAKPLPPNPGNNGPICQTDTIALFSAAPNPNATYLWSGPAGFSATVPNPTLRNINLQKAGVYTLSVSTPFCPPVLATTTLVINPTLQGIKTGNNAPLCAGQTLELTATFINGAAYAWQGPAGFLATTPAATRPNLTQAMAGNYTLTVTIPGCAPFSAIDSNIVINPSANLPSPRTNSPICEGATLIFTVNPTPGANYVWTGPNGFSEVTDIPSYSINNATPAASGIFTVSVLLGACPPVNGTASVTIRPTQQASATLDYFEQTICGQQDAVLTLFLGGTPPFEVVIAENGIPKIQSSGITVSPYQLTVPFSGLGTFNYTLVSVKDAALCSSGGNVGGFASVTYKDASPAEAVLSQSGPVTGCGGAEAKLGLSVNLTGRGPWRFAYRINGGAPIAVGPINQSPYLFEAPIPSNGANLYELVSLTDGANCGNTSIAGTVSFEANPGFSLTILEKTDGGCGNGRIIARGGGGIDNAVSYSLDGTVFTNTTGVFDNLPPGAYTVYARNRNCIQSQNVTLAGAEAPTLNAPVNVGENALSLSWSETRNAASYTLAYRVSGTSQWFNVSGITGTSRLITSGLLPNTSYDFRVQAVCATGWASPFSNIQQGTPTEGGGSGIGNCITPPTLRVSNRTANSATIGWLANATGAVCYIVSFGPSSADPETWSAVFLVQHPTASVTLSGLNPNQNYGVRIRTNCSLCSSRSGALTAWSAPVNFSTPALRGALVSESETEFKAQVYPNPASGSVTCQVESAEAETAVFFLSDLQGKALYRREAELKPGLNEEVIDLQNIAGGLYLLKAQTKRGEYTVKLMVK
jgi:hypothetical protein